MAVLMMLVLQVLLVVVVLLLPVGLWWWWRLSKRVPWGIVRWMARGALLLVWMWCWWTVLVLVTLAVLASIQNCPSTPLSEESLWVLTWSVPESTLLSVLLVGLWWLCKRVPWGIVRWVVRSALLLWALQLVWTVVLDVELACNW